MSRIKRKSKVYKEAIWFFIDLIAQHLDEKTHGTEHPKTDALLEGTLNALDTIRVLLPEQEILDDVLRAIQKDRKIDPFVLLN